MSKIAIVTDSTSNLPRELVEQYGIHVVPQVLIWEGETYEDGVDIHPKEFYERLKGAKIMPSTSQVTPKSFLEIYARLITEGYEVLSILIAEKLSGTISSALQAKAAFPNAPIEIVDLGTTSLAMGLCCFARRGSVEPGSRPERSPPGSRKRPPEGGCRLRGGYARVPAPRRTDRGRLPLYGNRAEHQANPRSR